MNLTNFCQMNFNFSLTCNRHFVYIQNENGYIEIVKNIIKEHLQSSHAENTSSC